MITRYKRNQFLTILKEQLADKEVTYKKWRNAITKTESLTGVPLTEICNTGGNWSPFVNRGIPVFCQDCYDRLDGDSYIFCWRCHNTMEVWSGMRSEGWVTDDGKLTAEFRKHLKLVRAWDRKEPEPV